MKCKGLKERYDADYILYRLSIVILIHNTNIAYIPNNKSISILI